MLNRAERIGTAFGWAAADVQVLLDEDPIGGYTDCAEPDYPEGSVFLAEGQILYALVRMLQPQVLIEVGTFVGCSTNHLAAACEQNGCGRIYAVDINPRAGAAWEPELRDRIHKVTADARNWVPPEPADFVFEDGDHSYDFTVGIWEHLLRYVTASSTLCCHDYYVDYVGVREGWDHVFGAPDFAFTSAQALCGIVAKRWVA